MDQNLPSSLSRNRTGSGQSSGSSQSSLVGRQSHYRNNSHQEQPTSQPPGQYYPTASQYVHANPEQRRLAIPTSVAAYSSGMNSPQEIQHNFPFHFKYDGTITSSSPEQNIAPRKIVPLQQQRPPQQQHYRPHLTATSPTTATPTSPHAPSPDSNPRHQPPLPPPPLNNTPVQQPPMSTALVRSAKAVQSAPPNHTSTASTAAVTSAAAALLPVQAMYHQAWSETVQRVQNEFNTMHAGFSVMLSSERTRNEGLMKENEDLKRANADLNKSQEQMANAARSKEANLVAEREKMREWGVSCQRESEQRGKKVEELLKERSMLLEQASVSQAEMMRLREEAKATAGKTREFIGGVVVGVRGEMAGRMGERERELTSQIEAAKAEAQAEREKRFETEKCLDEARASIRQLMDLRTSDDYIKDRIETKQERAREVSHSAASPATSPLLTTAAQPSPRPSSPHPLPFSSSPAPRRSLSLVHPSSPYRSQTESPGTSPVPMVVPERVLSNGSTGLLTPQPEPERPQELIQRAKSDTWPLPPRPSSPPIDRSSVVSGGDVGRSPMKRPRTPSGGIEDDLWKKKRRDASPVRLMTEAAGVGATARTEKGSSFHLLPAVSEGDSRRIKEEELEEGELDKKGGPSDMNLDSDDYAQMPNATGAQATDSKTAVAPSGSSVASTGSRIGINHLSILYETHGQKMVCRMCLTRGDVARSQAKSFPLNAAWPDLVGHCEGAHPKAWDDLKKLSPGQVAELGTRIRKSGGDNVLKKTTKSKGK